MLTRSSEDALAELLRPMLRTWLAENMPKIVERALRQELAGQLGSDRKTAAE
jgi:cell pole-organizing protein PopZ